MQKLATAVFGLLFLVSVGFIAVRAKRAQDAAPGAASAAPSASVAPEPEPEPMDAGLPDEPPEIPEELSEMDKLLAGGPVPKLPAEAPRTVTFGAILFSYKGAQFAAKDARGKEEARQQAEALIPKAKEDFREAAKQGDRGSSANLGRMPRGVLEPAIEYVLFTLDKDTVFDKPVDTPRGYWVVKRLR